jgi:hypothetical protein
MRDLPPAADKTRPNLTRRSQPDRHQGTWQVYYNDVHVGTIGERAGLPHDVGQWKWMLGFYPMSHRIDYDHRWNWNPSGTAAMYEEAKAELEAAWRDYLPRCTEANFAENRRARAATVWKYRMHDLGLPMPTQMASGWSKCFCGAPLTIQSVDGHIKQPHMEMA